MRWRGPTGRVHLRLQGRGRGSRLLPLRLSKRGDLPRVHDRRGLLPEDGRERGEHEGDRVHAEARYQDRGTGDLLWLHAAVPLEPGSRAQLGTAPYRAGASSSIRERKTRLDGTVAEFACTLLALEPGRRAVLRYVIAREATTG